MSNKLSRDQVEKYLEELKQRTLKSIEGTDPTISELHEALQKVKTEMCKERKKANPLTGMCSKCENRHIAFEKEYYLRPHTIARCSAVQIKSRRSGKIEDKEILIIKKNQKTPLEMRIPPTWCPKRIYSKIDNGTPYGLKGDVWSE